MKRKWEEREEDNKKQTSEDVCGARGVELANRKVKQYN